MKKALLVYNPVSGTGKSVLLLDEIVQYFQSRNMLVIPVRTPYREKTLYGLLDEGVSLVLAAGGDGTIHKVVNSLMKHGAPPPVGVIPLGTVNDFAENFGLSPQKFSLELLDPENQAVVDVGQVAGRYFINVASAGLLSDIAYKVDQRLKNNLGKLAYYLQGVAEIPNFRGVETRLISDGRTVFSGEMLLLLVLNGSRAGGFGGLMPKAELDDGFFDCLVFKKCALTDFINIVFKAMAGKHLEDPNVLYFRARSLEVTGSPDLATDLDGEQGPPLPWQVEVLPGGLKVLTAKQKQ